MAMLYRTSRIWIVDFTYDGRARRWFKPLPQEVDGAAHMAAQLHDLYGGRAQLASVRLASLEEEMQYIRGDVPRNVYCPTGR